MRPSMPPSSLLLLVAALCAAATASFLPQRPPLYGSGSPLVNRRAHASYINNSAGPVRIVQVVNVNVLPLRVTPAQGRDVETVEDHENAIPPFGGDRGGIGTQVDVFVDDRGRRPPPLRLTDFEPPHAPHPPPGVGFALPLAVYGPSPVHDDYLDQLVDFALEIVVKEVHAKDMDEVEVPDIHRSFLSKLGPLQLKGSFDATGGRARNLSTLHRTEQVVVRRVADSLMVSAGLGLQTLAVHYSGYKARLGAVEADGELSGTVASDSIGVTVNISLGQLHCIALQELKVDQLGDIDVKVTGLGELSWLTSKVVSWMTEHFKSGVVSSVEQQLTKVVSQVLGRVKCAQQSFLSFNLEP